MANGLSHRAAESSALGALPVLFAINYSRWRPKREKCSISPSLQRGDLADVFRFRPMWACILPDNTGPNRTQWKSCDRTSNARSERVVRRVALTWITLS